MSELEKFPNVLVITDTKIPTSAYQAIYHRMTAKVETLYERFEDAYIVSYESICHLNNLLEDCIKQFPIQEKSVRLVSRATTVSLTGFQVLKNLESSILTIRNVLQK